MSASVSTSYTSGATPPEVRARFTQWDPDTPAEGVLHGRVHGAVRGSITTTMTTTTTTADSHCSECEAEARAAAARTREPDVHRQSATSAASTVEQSGSGGGGGGHPSHHRHALSTRHGGTLTPRRAAWEAAAGGARATGTPARAAAAAESVRISPRRSGSGSGGGDGAGTAHRDWRRIAQQYTPVRAEEVRPPTPPGGRESHAPAAAATASAARAASSSKAEAHRELELVLKLDRLISIYSQRIPAAGAPPPAPEVRQVSPLRKQQPPPPAVRVRGRLPAAERTPAPPPAPTAMPSALGSISPVSQSPTQSPPRSQSPPAIQLRPLPTPSDPAPAARKPESHRRSTKARHCERHVDDADAHLHSYSHNRSHTLTARTSPARTRTVPCEHDSRIAPPRVAEQRVMVHPAQRARQRWSRSQSASPGRGGYGAPPPPPAARDQRPSSRARPGGGGSRYDFMQWEDELDVGDVPPMREVPPAQHHQHQQQQQHRKGYNGALVPRRQHGPPAVAGRSYSPIRRGGGSSGGGGRDDRLREERRERELEYDRAVQRDLEEVERIEMLRSLEDLEREVRGLVKGNRTLQKEKDLLTYENLSYRRRLQHADDALGQLRTLRNTVVSLDGLERKQDDIITKRQSAVRRLDSNVEHLSSKWGGGSEPAHHRLTRKGGARPARR